MLTTEEVIDLDSAPGQATESAPTDEPQTAVDTGAEKAFSGPESPNAYQFGRIGSAEYSDADMAFEQDMRTALHAEGIPTGIAHLGHMLIDQATRNGPPDADTLEMGRRSGIAELDRRHGAKAQEIIAAASKVFDRLDRRNPAIGDLLAATGVGSNPDFIEALARLGSVRGAPR